MMSGVTEYPHCPCCGRVDQDLEDGAPSKNEWNAVCRKCGNDYCVRIGVSGGFRTHLLLTATKEIDKTWGKCKDITNSFS